MTRCSQCGNEDDGEFVDLGIGSYEFWGQKGNDTNVQFVSTCCEATVLEEDGSEYEGPEDPRDEYDPAEER